MIDEARGSCPPDGLKRASDLLGDLEVDAGLEVIGLVNVVRILNVAHPTDCEFRDTEQYVRQVSCHGRPREAGEASVERLEVTVSNSRPAFDQRRRIELHANSERCRIG